MKWTIMLAFIPWLTSCNNQSLEYPEVIAAPPARAMEFFHPTTQVDVTNTRTKPAW